MPSGGARARSGPAPSPTSLHVKEGDWVRLPGAGRTTPAPAWPLVEQSAREAELWTREWSRPQALMWEMNGQEHEVALYVRRLVEVEKDDAPVTIGTLIRQMQEALGISVPGLNRNRWIIDGSITSGSTTSPTAAQPARQSSKSRLKVVAPGDTTA